MIVGTNVIPPPQLILNDDIFGVFIYKLLGTKLKWDNHIDSKCSKASSRLYFFTELKRNGATVKDMVHFNETVIRSVLEYACPAWHSSLTVEQCFRIESIQIHSFKICHDYSHMSLSDLQAILCKRFFMPLRSVKAARSPKHSWLLQTTW